MAGQQMKIAAIAALLQTMLSPQKGERLLFITDYSSDKPGSRHAGRWELITRWHNAASLLSDKLSFRVLPIARYPKTGRNNAELPKKAVTHDGGHVNDLTELIASSNIVIAMTEYSASAPLLNIAGKSQSLRIISMPGVNAEMEPAMSADPSQLESRGRRLQAVVQSAAGFELVFDGTGIPRNTKLYIDTRANRWILEAGICSKAGDFINFPSGELFTPPYEGATPEGRREFGDSQTEGILPVYSPTDNKVAFLRVEKNRITRVQGDSEAAKRIIEDIASDERNANIAELGLGINEKARCGAGVPVLEAEKSGPHVAYGRNDHFGTGDGIVGTVRASVHQDFVYARDSPITCTVYAVYPNGKRVLIAERGKIVAV